MSTFRMLVLTFSVLFPFVVIIYVLKTALSTANITGPRAVPTLQQLFVLTRHGNRGPGVTLPDFPYQCNDTNVWPYGKGQLTTRGRVQMYNLGRRFRSLYDGFLNGFYRPEDMIAQSTQVDRTMMSAAQFLAGLYPPMGFQVWNRDLMWQPIPVFITDKDNSMMVPNTGPNICPRFRQLQNKSLTDFEKQNRDNLTELLQLIQPHTELNMSSGDAITTVNMVWESIFCADNEGLPLPEWTKSVYPEPLLSLYGKLYTAYTIARDEMIRLIEGLLFQEIMQSMEAKIEGTLEPDRKLYLYSGHDNTMKGILAILGLGEFRGVASTGSALVLELHRDEQSRKHHVEVLYIDGAIEDLEPFQVTIPGCGQPCDFHQLSQITEKFYNIINYEDECQRHYKLKDLIKYLKPS